MKLILKIIYSLLLLIVCSPLLEAQTSDNQDIEIPNGNLNSVKNKWEEIKDWCVEKNVANGLDLGISISSMGIGLEVATPVTKWVDLRLGIDWFPRFKMPMDFNLNTFSHGMPTGDFNHIAQKVFYYTGIEMDETVRMYGVGSMVNFKFIADIYPVPSNRHWHVSAGFYAGTSRIGKAYNSYEEKPTLVALNIYNRGYEYFTNIQDVYDVPLGGGAYMSAELVERLQNKFSEYGRMGIHIGDFKDGKPYIMEPAPDGTVSAKAYVNHVKPYIGAGYSTDLDKAGKWHFAVDLGMVIWGGAPNVINHDYVSGKDINFTKELVNVRGKVGNYLRAIKAFPVYPLVGVKFSYTIL